MRANPLAAALLCFVVLLFLSLKVKASAIHCAATILCLPSPPPLATQHPQPSTRLLTPHLHTDWHRERRFADAIRAGRISKVEAIQNLCILAAVGQQMASRKGVCATMFSALAKANINIRRDTISTPIHKARMVPYPEL